MEISVIIVSYNRPKYLIDTLKYCLEQSVPAKEVIVVDASDAEYQISDKFVIQYPQNLKYIKWSEIGNISRQRNVGIKNATGDIILFLDDDVRFETDLFSKIKNRFEELNADALSGIIESSHRKVSKEVFVFKSNPLLYLGQPSFHQNDFLVQTYLVSAACFAVKKESLLSIGGFDEQLMGVFDDSDVGIRLTAAGYLVYHDNKFRVYHYAAKGSGSRSPKLGSIWKYSNICYLQLKHFYTSNPESFYRKSIKFLIKPSRRYLTPFKVFAEIMYFKKGYHEALSRIKIGPKYLS